MKKIDKITIGQNISDFLYYKRKKQKWLAEKCGVTPSHINQIIKGKISPSLGLLVNIADSLEIEINDLIKKHDEVFFYERMAKKQ